MKRAKRKVKPVVRRDLAAEIANLDRILEEAAKRGHAPAFVRPKRTIDPPTLTMIEWRAVARIIAAIGWIPRAWVEPIASLTAKVRAYLGDEAFREDSEP